MMQTGVLKALKWYQQHISAATPAHCRYFPTCSNYTIEAVQRFGVVRGLIMGGARILRCHPFVRGGFDFVPSHFSLKRNPQPGVTDRLPK